MNHVRYTMNLQRGKVHSLSLDIRQIYRLFHKNNETRLREYQLRRSAVYVELPNEGAFGIPDVSTIATT